MIDSPDLIEKVHALLDKHKRLYRNLYWFSLTDSVNEKLKKYDPKIRTITSVETVLKILALYYIGANSLYLNEYVSRLLCSYSK